MADLRKYRKRIKIGGWDEVVKVSWQLYLSKFGVSGCAFSHISTFNSFITHAYTRNINWMKTKLVASPEPSVRNPFLFFTWLPNKKGLILRYLEMVAE